MHGIVPRGCIGLGEALDLIATTRKVPGWRGWAWEIPIFHRALILAADDRGTGNEDALEAVIEDSRQIRDVIVYAMRLFYGTPPLHEDAVPTLVFDGDGNSIPIPVEEWRRRTGALQLFVLRQWSPRHGAPAFEIFVRRVPLEEALAREAAPHRTAGRFSLAKVSDWYTNDWIPACKAEGRVPSRVEDWEAAKAKFGPVPRDAVRKIRKEKAPSEWQLQGRRSKTGDQKTGDE